jgi:indolepyruvate ferredoxin oxidoreductase alpha subunit
LSVATSGQGQRGVILAGTLGPALHGIVAARQIPCLRLGCSWPLPRRALVELMRGLKQVIVLEEGEPFLETAVAALASDEQLTCQVQRMRPPSVLDAASLQKLLDGLTSASGEAGAVTRAAADWKEAFDAVAKIDVEDLEPWTLHLARARKKLKRFPDGDRRKKLLEALRKQSRPAIVVGDPSATALYGIGEGLVDVKMNMGSAAPIAGALSAAQSVDGAPMPLPIALIGDTNLLHSELPGMVDNALAARDVLHVVVVNRASEMTGGVKTPYLADAALEAVLRGAGLGLSTVQLADKNLEQLVGLAVAAKGARVLVCYGEPAPPVDGSRRTR